MSPTLGSDMMSTHTSSTLTLLHGQQTDTGLTSPFLLQSASFPPPRKLEQMIYFIFRLLNRTDMNYEQGGCQ